MTTMTETIRKTEKCLVKVGRSGAKTHRGEVVSEVTNPGTPRQRTRIITVYCVCQMQENLNGRRGLVHLPGTNWDDATCGLCGKR